MFRARAVSDSENDFDAGDRSAFGRLGQTFNSNRPAIYVGQFARTLVIKMVMVGDVGIEVRPTVPDDDLAQESGTRKLVERIINCGQGHLPPRRLHLAVKLLGRDVPVAALKQEPGQGHALLSRPQSSLLQAFDNFSIRSMVRHLRHMAQKNYDLKGFG